MYEQLHLRVNEKKTEVGAHSGVSSSAIVFGADQETRSRLLLFRRCSTLSGSSPDALEARALLRLPNRCGYTFEAGSPTSGWHKPRRYSKIWIRGYVTDYGLSSLSTGARERLSIIASAVSGRRTYGRRRGALVEIQRNWAEPYTYSRLL